MDDMKSFLSQLDEETIYKLAGVLSVQVRKAVKNADGSKLGQLLTFRQLLMDIHTEKLKAATKQLEIWGDVLT